MLGISRCILALIMPLLILAHLFAQMSLCQWAMFLCKMLHWQPWSAWIEEETTATVIRSGRNIICSIIYSIFSVSFVIPSCNFHFSFHFTLVCLIRYIIYIISQDIDISSLKQIIFRCIEWWWNWRVYTNLLTCSPQQNMNQIIELKQKHDFI